MNAVESEIEAAILKHIDFASAAQPAETAARRFLRFGKALSQ